MGYNGKIMAIESTEITHIFTTASVVINFFAMLFIPVFIFMVKRLWDSIKELNHIFSDFKEKSIDITDVQNQVYKHQVECRLKRRDDSINNYKRRTDQL